MARRIPIDRVLEVVNKAREAASSVNDGLLVCVLVDDRVPRWLAEAVRDALVPQMGTTTVDVRAVSGFGRPLEGANMAIVLAGGSDRAVAAALDAYTAAGVPCAVCAETSLEVPEGMPAETPSTTVREVVGSEPDALLEKLCAWMLDVADPVAVAANFAFCRPTETERLIQRCALSNAVVGTIDILHGADLPIMLANQAKLALDLAAAHGEAFGPSRVAEFAAVSVAGLVYRGVARALCEQVKPLSFAIRGAVGYTGSLVTGSLLAARFGETPGVVASALELLEQAVGGLGGDSGLAEQGPGNAVPRAALDVPSNDDSVSSGDDGYIVLEAGGESA